MLSHVELVCAVCGTGFQRASGEVNRNERLNRPIYCSRNCAGAANLKNIPVSKMGWSHLELGNRADTYSPFRTCFRIARNRARLYGKAFTITLDDLIARWRKQDGVCPYTGWKMVLPTSSAQYNLMGKSPRNASLDRIDSAEGYTPKNVQFVCYMANVAKNDFSHEEMLEFCRVISEPHCRRGH